MNRHARYAIYYTPHPASPLWALGSSWLGRDAMSGQSLQRPEMPRLSRINLDRLTADPRRYGFHATLKAPFEAAGAGAEEGLLELLEAFTLRRSAFDVHLEVAALGNFLALRLAEPSKPMDELHRDCVCDFDGYRKPISDEDLARKRRARLTPEQDARLLQWGYPYIFDDFHFHMTFTSRIASRASLEPIREALETLLSAHLAVPHRIEGIGLFGQVDRDNPFHLVQWFPLRGRLEAAAPERGAQA